VSIFDVAIRALDGAPADLGQYRGKAVLVVNVASKCGLTPQYASLQRLYETFAGRGLVVLGVPCNQFGGQEPGTSLQIKDFCEANFGITFPITEKVEVNGPQRHPLFEQLTATPDADGVAGDVRWNFEKFLVGPDGAVAARFRPLTDPLAPELVAAVERVVPLAGGTGPVAEPAPQAAGAGWPGLAEFRWPSLPTPAGSEVEQTEAADGTPLTQPTPSTARWRRTWSA
jgi:glutathione peroxidase